MTTVIDNNSLIDSQYNSCGFCRLSQCEMPILERPIGIAVPSIGAFVEGWLLVVPNRHVVSLADLTEHERIDFHAFVEEVEQIVVGEYEYTVMFEHGPAKPDRNAGCGIDHAHLHVVPVKMVLHEAVTTDDDDHTFQWRRAVQPWDAQEEHSCGLDYLFVREVNGTAWITTTPSAPSQLFRRAIASHLGEQIWDWKEDNRYEMVASTYKKLLGF